MRRIGFVLVLLLLISLGACQTGLPPTIIVMEVTRIVTVVVTPAPSATQANHTATIPTTPSDTVTPTISPTPDVFPTPAIGQIYLVEQEFQFGWMYWLEPVDQIWIATTDETGKAIWTVYNDTFEDEMPETDPALDALAPKDTQQPRRGFGKLWRENPEVQTALGWALQREEGYVTRYEYHSGGSVNADNQYISGPGYHIIETLNRQFIRFNEAERTWAIVTTP